MDALIQDMERSGKPKTFLSLTSARSLVGLLIYRGLSKD
jgi:hypothetical protein